MPAAGLWLAGAIVLLWGGSQAALAAVIYSQDFEGTSVGADPAGWTDPTSDFQVIDSAGNHKYAKQASGLSSGNAFITSAPFPLADYTYTAEVLYPGGTGGGIIGRVTDDDDFYLLRIQTSGRNVLELFSVVGGTFTSLGTDTMSSAAPTDEAVLLRLMFDGTTITGQVAALGDPSFSAPLAEVSITNAAHASGGIGVRNSSNDQGHIYDNLTVVIPEPAVVGLMLAGGLTILARRRV